MANGETVCFLTIEGNIIRTTKDFITGIDIYVSPDKNTFDTELTLGGLETRWQPINVGAPAPSMMIRDRYDLERPGYEGIYQFYDIVEINGKLYKKYLDGTLEPY